MSSENDAPEEGSVRARFIPFVPLGNPGASGELLSESLAPRRVLKADGVTEAPRSKQLSIEDQFSRLAEHGKIIEPPFSLENLALIPEESSIVGPCVDAMEANVDGFGWDLDYSGPEEMKESPEALAEKERIEDLLETINPRESFLSLRKKLRRDYEPTGNAYIEVIRNLKGDIMWFEHLSATTIRLAPLDSEPQKVKIAVLGSRGKMIEKEGFVYFRRFVQIVGRKKAWFKEFGDKRVVSAKDGKVADENLPFEDRANEIIHYRRFSSRTPYGVPCYIGNLPSIRGGRMSEIVDVRYFERNCIPQMVVTVSGGTLSAESFQQVEKTFTEAGGLKNFWGVLILEGTPQSSGLEDKGGVQINMKSMLGDRLSDAQFLKYKEACVRNARSSWRIPPIFAGLTQDYTYASAMASRITAEEQVFIPERKAFDEIINLQVFRDMGIKYWKFYTKGPTISDMAVYVKAVQAFSEVGAMTPNTAIVLANELLDVDMKKIDQPWGDFPFAIVERLAEQGRLSGLEGLVTEGNGGLEALAGRLRREIGSEGEEDQKPNGKDETAFAGKMNERDLVLRELVRKIDKLLRKVKQGDSNNDERSA